MRCPQCQRAHHSFARRRTTRAKRLPEWGRCITFTFPRRDRIRSALDEDKASRNGSRSSSPRISLGIQGPCRLNAERQAEAKPRQGCWTAVFFCRSVGKATSAGPAVVAAYNGCLPLLAGRHGARSWARKLTRAQRRAKPLKLPTYFS